MQSQRVLVVDDNPVNLKVASAMLARLGYPHDTMIDGAQALDAIDRAQQELFPYVIVLLDSHMPVMDGQTTARAVKQRLGDHAPVMIGISASTLGDDRQRCLDAGMSDYLPKPLKLELLATTLKRWCEPDPMPTLEMPQLADTTTLLPDPMWIDEARWNELGECDDPSASLRRDMAQDFLSSLSARCQAIEEAFTSSIPERLFEAAHVLKGAAENLGAQSLGRACAAIELANETSPALLRELNEATEGTRMALDCYLAAMNRSA